MRGPDWRREADYEPLKALDTPELAGEFLRRNPDYQLDHERLSRLAAAGHLTSAELEAFAARWGVRFRAVARPFRMDAAKLAQRRGCCFCPFSHRGNRT
ncbi:transcriptional regulator domain-containing protein [Sphingosinicella rhizophila]|uniref:DUF6499 domain-containing protein n=1 Tax=Sphingosinicella rhizophila TaxID=3050082 RepID=A0ABU3QAM5_9SPHN|nr:DUF6499 domain-containing protein [Sphingosinicella sp. GR2756]MDT9600421.1 DUF6499 domain-containing protein [Sphingosinicella sp. GR2756]